ncbi:MAG: hypothetical protein J6B89_03355 [Bacilli bacterium]|nr:hypothetical protein [Bacilli bacterium]
MKTTILRNKEVEILREVFDIETEIAFLKKQGDRYYLKCGDANWLRISKQNYDKILQK